MPLKNIFLLFIFFLLSCGGSHKKYTAHYFAMDTVFEIALFVPDNKTGDAVLEDLKKETERIERMFSVFFKDGDLWKINNRANKFKMIVSPEVAGLIKRGLDLSIETNGAFDITVAPLVWLWGFGTGLTPHIPPEDSIKEILRHVNYKNITVKADTLLFTDSLVKIDMGGIAKGYALEKLAEIIKKHGIKSFMIDAGGDVFVGNQKPGGIDWVIGIRNPRKKDDILCKIYASNTTIASSGDYERFFIKDSVRYNHIFNPKSGYPARDYISGTVISDDPVRATIYSKVIIINGKKTNPLSLPGIKKYYLVDENLSMTIYPPEKE